jgi:hypothetical protein
LLNNAPALQAGSHGCHQAAQASRKGVIEMHGSSKLTGWIVGLVAAAVSIDVLATELPRVMPYLTVVAVVFIIIRLVFYHTNGW